MGYRWHEPVLLWKMQIHLDLLWKYSELKRLEVWHSENLVLGQASSSPQGRSHLGDVCGCVCERAQNAGSSPLSPCRSGKLLVWGEASERAVEAQTPLLTHRCPISAKSIVCMLGGLFPSLSTLCLLHKGPKDPRDEVKAGIQLYLESQLIEKMAD